MNRIERDIIRRLKYIEELGERIGMYGRFRHLPEDTFETRLTTFYFFDRYLDHETSIASRAACALALDYLLPEWKDFLPDQTALHITNRNDPEVRKWRNAVFERDGYQCVRCGNKDDLHAHHIVHWAKAPEYRVYVDNGETLCKECHATEHEEIASFIMS